MYTVLTISTYQPSKEQKLSFVYFCSNTPKTKKPTCSWTRCTPSNPRHTLTNIFCTFSSFNSLVWLSIHNSAPYNIFGRAIRFHNLVATTGLIPLNLHPRLAKPIQIAWPLLAASRIGMRLSTSVCQFFPRLCQTLFPRLFTSNLPFPVHNCGRVMSFLAEGQYNSFFLIKG